MIILLFVVIIASIFYFDKARNKSVLNCQPTVTPSFVVTYDVDGEIKFAKCKRTGKFVSKSLATQEIIEYMFC